MSSPGTSIYHWQRCFWELYTLSPYCFRSSQCNYSFPWLVVLDSMPQIGKAIIALPWLSSYYFISLPKEVIFLTLGYIYTAKMGREVPQDLELIKVTCSRLQSCANNRTRTMSRFLNFSSGFFHSINLLRHLSMKCSSYTISHLKSPRSAD